MVFSGLPGVNHSRGGCARKFSAKGYTIPVSMGNKSTGWLVRDADGRRQIDFNLAG